MKLLFLFCLLAFISPEPYSEIRLRDAGQPTAARQSIDGYRTFQPSKIKKQKRKLRKKISALGWGLFLFSLVVIAGTLLLTMHLWPMAGLFWRIFMVWLGLSLTVGFLLVGLIGLVYGRHSDRDLRSKAIVRVVKLGDKLDFTPEKTWCFPDEYFRLSVAANKNALLIVDYQQDKGWIIPKENIVGIQTDSVPAAETEARYPSGPDTESIVLFRPLQENLPPHPPAKPLGPMQVLDFQCRNQMLRRMTLVYHPSVFGDSTQIVAADLRALWSEN
ncbi:MAG TPA: hypothetical protein PLM41_06910 [Saprospiraceae bacterium]|nr:hypothetical protein [Saprospiraceae bacterium]